MLIIVWILKQLNLHSNCIMCIGLSPPPLKNTTSPFFGNCPSPPFLGNSPLYVARCFFVTPPPSPTNQIFQWTSTILKFSSLKPSHLLKVTKVLVKISQLLFINYLNVVKYFRFYFLCKNCNRSPLKSHPLFSSNPPLKTEILSSPPPFWKFGQRLNPPSCRMGGGCTLWAESILLEPSIFPNNE